MLAAVRGSNIIAGTYFNSRVLSKYYFAAQEMAAFRARWCLGRKRRCVRAKEFCPRTPELPAKLLEDIQAYQEIVN